MALSRLSSGLLKKGFGAVGSQIGTRLPTKPVENAAGPLPGAVQAGNSDFLANQEKLIGEQFDKARGRLAPAKDEAGRSALENARRLAAIRGTSGAGFENKLQAQAQEGVERTFGDLSTGLDIEEASAKQAAGQFSEQMGEQKRQFDSTFNLQRWIASNEMDMSKMATFVNMSTAFKEAGLRNPKDWGGLFETLGRLGFSQGLGVTGPNPQKDYNPVKYG